MKSYYFRNVMNQITKKKLESGRLFVIVFFMTFSLSLLHFFGYNDSIESNIGNSLNLSYEINNIHIISKAKMTELKQANDPFEYFNQFTDFIEDIGTHEDLEYFNYNIHFPFYGSINNALLSFDSYGVSNENYLKNNKIELKELYDYESAFNTTIYKNYNVFKFNLNKKKEVKYLRNDEDFNELFELAIRLDLNKIFKRLQEEYPIILNSNDKILYETIIKKKQNEIKTYKLIK